MARNHGIDTSHWSGKLNFEVIQTKNSFIIMKASEGTTFTDDRFLPNWMISSMRGLYRGHYHYYIPDADPEAQAEKYFSVVKQTGERAELPPVLDVEELPLNADAVKKTLDAIEERFNEVPMVYTRANIWNTMGLQSWAARHPLWIARYPFTHWEEDLVDIIMEAHPGVPLGWQSYLLWQWSKYGWGPYYGIESLGCDVNISCNDLSTYNFIRAPKSYPVLANPPSIPTLAQGKCLVHGLRVRVAPRIYTKFVSWLPQGYAVKIGKIYSDGENTWGLIVKDNNVVGWSAIEYNGTKFIEVNENVPTLPTLSVLEAGLRLRTGPGIGYEVLSKLPAQSIVDVVAVRDYGKEIWVGVNSSYGAGWVAFLYGGKNYLR